MAEKSPFLLRERNPDVLTSIANLSNDEVFTPPSFANQMLDTVAAAWATSNKGANIWADKSVTFLDPFTKSGVFLREIVRRLSDGLEKEFPDLQERVNHVLTKQVFGVAITELTALLARRSVYCSKFANGKHSIASEFTTPEGNIWFERTEHTWVGGKEKLLVMEEDGNELEKTIDGTCKFCGAKQKEYERGLEAESHAYSLIHTAKPSQWAQETFGEDMQFDVIIGNPPYQLDDGGYGTSAAPIYDKFVQQAKALNPRYLAMVIPARWYSGGKGLSEFRDSMLTDNRNVAIEDFPDSSQVFPGVQIKGGVCYFLWDRDNPGQCLVRNHYTTGSNAQVSRKLLEDGADSFIRFNEAIPILHKIQAVEKLRKEESFASLVSSNKPYGLRTFFKGKTSKSDGDVMLYQNGGIGYIAPGELLAGKDSVDCWKVFIPMAGSGSDSFPHSILGRPFVGAPGTACTETYNRIGCFSSSAEAENVVSYIQTRLMRFLVLLHKPSQHASRSVYSFVPIQDFSRSWSDEELYAKYKLTEEEIAFIESMIRPMELGVE